MTQVGYARVSSAGQSLEVQLAKLAGCQKIFQEQHSGSSDKRPRLLACLEYTFSGGYAKNPYSFSEAAGPGKIRTSPIVG
jgi:DNA invertase Pin-like site-specific DNA recombinase